MKSKLFNNLNSSLETIKRYKWNSIFFQYLKMFIAITLILMLIITSVFFAFFYSNLRYKQQNSIEQSFSYLENDIDNVFSESSTLYNTLVAKNSIQAFMQTDDILKLNTIIKKDLINNYDFATTYASSSKYIKSIILYSKNCGYVLGNNGNNYLSNYSNIDWLLGMNNSALFYLTKCRDNSNDFYLCYNFFENNSTNGIIVFRVDAKSLTNVYSKYDANKVSIAITDCNQNRIMLCGKSNIFPTMTKSPEINKFITTYKNNRYYTVGNSNNNIIECSVYEKSISITTYVKVILIIIILSVVFALILALILSLRAYKTVDNLILAVNNVNTDNNSDTSSDEIIYITTSILNLIDHNNMLENKMLSTTLNLRNLQFDILQNQLSPHFLFNVLNTLHMYLMKNYGYENVTSEIIMKLSDLLAISLDTSIYMVPISKEIEYTKKYINIQSIMYDNRFSATWNISPDVINCYTLKFSLQPLVENALSHGIKPYLSVFDTIGVLEINILKKNSNIVFEIINSGLEISNEKLAQVRNELNNSKSQNGKQIGLKNVHKRIQLLYGEDYGCDISWANKRTTVTITIPVVENL